MDLFSKYILRPILDSVRNFGDRDAFVMSENAFSYKEFANRISAIRCFIHEMNSSEPTFALVANDDLDTYASIIALWMEGKAYVPLHPKQPIDRNLSIIRQVGITNVIDSNPQSSYKGIVNNIVYPSLLNYKNDYLDDWAEPSEDGLAYIIFTSGSTGEPKGVQLSRRNIATFIDSFGQTDIVINEEDRCLQAFDLTFDVSVQGFLVALIHGACIFTIPVGEVKYLYIAFLLQKHRLTFGAFAPSMLAMLKPYFNELDAGSIKTSIVTAEACPLDLINEWFKCAKNTDIYDFYGPTEATIYCTYYKLTREGENLSRNGVVSIGKPMANVDVIVLDEKGNVIENDEIGELCVSGNQVTLGYWNNEEKNNRSFLNINNIRYYHTGDLCFKEANGNILYCGRIDQQTKIQGYRVELGEIEYHSRNFYDNKRRVVAITYQTDGFTEIALYIESEKEDPNCLLGYLKSKMPQYMMPHNVIYVPIFPLNKSEKIDRNELLKLIK